MRVRLRMVKRKCVRRGESTVYAAESAKVLARDLTRNNNRPAGAGNCSRPRLLILHRVEDGNHTLGEHGTPPAARSWRNSGPYG